MPSMSFPATGLVFANQPTALSGRLSCRDGAHYRYRIERKVNGAAPRLLSGNRRLRRAHRTELLTAPAAVTPSACQPRNHEPALTVAARPRRLPLSRG